MPPRASVMVISVFLTAALASCTAAVPARTVVVNPIPTPTPLQLTGSTLKTTLLPASAFPPGYAVDPQSSSDSGPSLIMTSPSATASPRTCQQVLTAALDPTPFKLTAEAKEDLLSTAGDASTYHQIIYSQGVEQFATATDAAGYFDSLRAAYTRCPSYTAKAGGVTATIRGQVAPALPVAGHRAYRITQQGRRGSVALAAEALFVIDGTDVYRTQAAAFGVPLSTQVPLPGLAAKLIARVRALK